MKLPEFEKAHHITVGWQKFIHGEESRLAVSYFAGFFYKFKFLYNGKFHSKVLGNYRIVFLVWLRDSVKQIKHKFESHQTES